MARSSGGRYAARVVWCVALVLLVCSAGIASDNKGDDDKKQKHPSGCPSSCADWSPCTLDFCESGACVHTPLTGAACDDGDACTENDRCREGGCEGSPRTCADGFACTTDACVDGGCVHDASDASCGGGQECLVTTCAPARADADERGCVTSLVATGAACAQDDEPCTDDMCRSGRCAHEEVVPVDSCAPIREPFHRARELLALADALGRALATHIDRSGGGPSVGPTRGAEDDLEASVQALGGESAVHVARTRFPFDTTSQRRARAAAVILRRTPGELARALRRVRRNAGAKPPAAMREQGDALVEGIRRLRGTLVRMTQLRQTISR